MRKEEYNTIKTLLKDSDPDASSSTSYTVVYSYQYGHFPEFSTELFENKDDVLEFIKENNGNYDFSVICVLKGDIIYRQ